MCENACGKLPTSRRARVSYSSASRPTSLRSAEQPLEEPPRVVHALQQDVGVGQPEAARQERALACREDHRRSVRVS